jgi:hypothetical protein
VADGPLAVPGLAKRLDQTWQVVNDAPRVLEQNAEVWTYQMNGLDVWEVLEEDA